MANSNVLILKELERGFNTGKPVSGILRVEKESGVTELNLSLVNLSPLLSGELYLYIFGNNNLVYTFLLSYRPSSFHKTVDELSGVSSGYASALVLVKEDIPLTLAFGKTDGCDISLSTAKKLIAERCLSERKSSKRKQAEPTPPEKPPVTEPNIPKTPTPPPTEPLNEPEQVLLEQAYNDEAVATENYFELDKELKDKLSAIKENQNEELSNANGNATDTCQKEEKTGKSRADFLSNEEDLFAGEVKNDTPRKPFYITAERELKTLFDTFPAYDNLKCYFPDSRWVKIAYDSDRFYIVGLIKEDGKEKYICYGVPENYSPEPPKELKGYCTFIPLSIFDMQGAGFWMMFQDAVSGECIMP